MNRNAVCIGAATLLGVTGLSAQTTPDDFSEWEREIAQSFVELDANGDGVLDREEAVDNPPLGTHFSMADMDGDQQITIEEFAAFEILVDSIETSEDSSI